MPSSSLHALGSFIPPRLSSHLSNVVSTGKWCREAMRWREWSSSVKSMIKMYRCGREGSRPLQIKPIAIDCRTQKATIRHRGRLQKVAGLEKVRSHVSFTPRKHIESFPLVLVNTGLFSTSELFFRNVQQALCICHPFWQVECDCRYLPLLIR